MKLKERVTLGIVMSLTALLGFYMLSDYCAIELSIPFSLLGLIGARISMRDEKNWKWEESFLFLICVIALAVVGGGKP